MTGPDAPARPVAPVVIALTAILVATLVPHPSAPRISGTLCVLCGERSVADALLNVLLFLPLGLGFGIRGLRMGGAVGLIALTTVSIECAQLFIPGRDASVSDLIFNVMGGAVGLAVYRCRLLVHGLLTRRAAAPLWAAGATGLVVLTAYLLSPLPPAGPYRVLWTPRPPGFHAYPGRLVHASLGPVSLPAGEAPQADSLLALFRSGASLHLYVIPDRSGSTGPAPLIIVNAVPRREVLLISADGPDILIRRRTRAADWRLDQPDLRAPQVLAEATAGDTAAVVVLHARNGTAVRVNGRETAGLRFTTGRAWALLLYPESFPTWLKLLLDAGWLAGIAAPLGFALHRWPGSAVLSLLLVVAGLATLPAWSPIGPPRWGEWVGVASGVAAGVAASRWLLLSGRIPA